MSTPQKSDSKTESKSQTPPYLKGVKENPLLQKMISIDDDGNPGPLRPFYMNPTSAVLSNCIVDWVLALNKKKRTPEKIKSILGIVKLTEASNLKKKIKDTFEVPDGYDSASGDPSEIKDTDLFG
jgi:hypothetical protein